MSVIEMKPTRPESPAIETLRVVDAGKRIIAVTWRAGRHQGREDVVCLSPLIDTLKFYAPIRKNSEIFETVRIIDDGYAIAWGNGSIDMSASSVERLAEEAMTGEDFREFMKRNALTHQAAAAALGRSKRQIEHYVQYEYLPRMVVLACIGYEQLKKTEVCFNSTYTISSWPEAAVHVSNLSGLNSLTMRAQFACGWRQHHWSPLMKAAIIEKKQDEHR